MHRKIVKCIENKGDAALLRLILLGALLLLFAMTIRSTPNIFGRLMIIYLVIILIIFLSFLSEQNNLGYSYPKEIKHLSRVMITSGHTVLLLMAISSYLMTSKIVSSWYVSCNIFGEAFEESVIDIIRYMALFIIVSIVFMIKGMYDCRYQGLECFSVTIHALGLIGTLFGYICIIRSNANIMIYGGQSMRCEWIYAEALVLASCFLVYCNWMKKRVEKNFKLRS